MVSFSFKISSKHPALAGHFANNPIVPGAVVIDELICGLSTAMPDTKVLSVLFVKFLSPILPETEVEVNINEKFRFECLHNGIKMAAGQLAVN